MCQHSQRHEPTPTNVNISDVNALITMSVLFAVASLATTIGGLGHTPPSSEQNGGGQLLIPSFFSFSDIHVFSKQLIKFGGPQSKQMEMRHLLGLIRWGRSN